MKQIIRLTEGDLHRIIRKSINEITKDSPETIASYALGRDLQARGLRPLSNAQKRKRTHPLELGNKAYYAKEDAINAWNNKYETSDRFMSRYPNDYCVNNRYSNHIHNNPKNPDEVSSSIDANTVYYPQVDLNTTSFYNDANGKVWHQFNPNYYDSMDGDEGIRTARRMANPDPRRDYEKGKGWVK